MDFFRKCRIIKSLEAADANYQANRPEPQSGRWHPSRLAKLEQRKIQAMTKSLEVISEAIRNPKHPFRKVDNQPKKTLKHRYERRKIKGYLHLEDWMANEAT
jgi:hypothetical protein